MLFACGSGDRAEPAFSQDRSGIEVVESTEPVWGSVEGWRLASQPWLLIGEEKEERFRFNRIRGVFLLPDGSIVVANGGPPPEIRVFDERGGFRAAFGGEGEGPGEFRSLLGVWLLPPDTILAFRSEWCRVSHGARSESGEGRYERLRRP
jgi:hypothetical protein